MIKTLSDFGSPVELYLAAIIALTVLTFGGSHAQTNPEVSAPKSQSSLHNNLHPMADQDMVADAARAKNSKQGFTQKPDTALMLATPTVSDERLAGYHSALETVFPMTPEMIKAYQDALNNNQRAIFSNVYPNTVDDAAMVSLEPGENPIELNVAPGIASVVGFFDATGNPWPIQQYVLGDGESFQIAQLGERSSALAISPTSRGGWSNLVVVLEGEASPVVLKVVVDPTKAHFRRRIQVMKQGPNSHEIVGVDVNKLPVAGDRELLAVLTGAGLRRGSVRVPVTGVDALAWALDDQLYVRSRLPLLSPPWTDSLTGPGGIRAYRLRMSSSLLFSLDGRIVRARLDLP